MAAKPPNPVKAAYQRADSLTRGAARIDVAKRQQIAAEHGFDVAAALREIDELVKQAVACNQFSAASSLIASKAKIAGLMSERVEVAVESIDLVAALTARQREFLRPSHEAPPAPAQEDIFA